MKKIYITLIIALIAFTGCSNDSNKVIEDYHMTLEKIIDKANKENNTALDISLYSDSKSKRMFSSEDVEWMLEPSNKVSQSFSIAEAKSDIEHLFKLLKYEYAGYKIYGGDESFLKAKEAILNQIDDLEKITPSALGNIIVDELRFVNDNHLKINDSLVAQANKTKYYSNEKISFLRDGMGFYTEVNDIKKYITSINNDTSIESHMKLSIDEEGKLVYFVGQLAEDGPVVKKVEVSFNDESKSSMELFKASYKMNHRKQTFEESTIENVPILSVRRFDDNPNETYMKDFVESAEKYKNEDILIIDLRGNYGGTSFWNELWISEYTNGSVKYGVITIDFLNSINEYIYNNYMSENIRFAKEIYDMSNLNEFLINYQKEMSKALESGSYRIIRNEGGIAENNNKIYVLIDNAVASSAELFLLNLKALNNVVVIGSNTAGASDITNVINTYLPNSRVKVSLGLRLNIKLTDPHLHDGVGVEPDIWLTSTDMIDRLLKMINNYQ